MGVSTSHYWLMPLIFGAIPLIRLVATGSKVRVKGNELIFQAALPYRIIILLGCLGAFSVLLATWRESQLWENLALFCIASGIAFGWPTTILITPGRDKTIRLAET